MLSPAPPPTPIQPAPSARPTAAGSSPDHARIVASLGVGAWQRDLQTGEAWYSPCFKALLGYADDELPNDAAAIAALAHPDDRTAFEQIREAALATLQPRAAEGRMLTRGGEWRWFRATMRAWPGDDGRPSMLVGSLADVHVEKSALLEVRALAERYDRAMAASSEAHFEKTVGLEDFFMSPRLPMLLGYPEGTPAPTSQTYLEWVHPDDRSGLLAVIRRAAAGPCSWEFDYRLRRVDGSYRWFGGRGSSAHDAQGRLRMTGMVGDIDVQKRARQELALHREQLQQMVDDRTARLSAALALAESERTAAERANFAKATFLAHMSHELRTPLNGVMGMTQLARRLAPSEAQRNYLDLAAQSGQTLLRILDDVLDFAKAEAGKLQLIGESFDLPQLVAETVRSFMPQIGKRPLHLLFDCLGDVARVHGDPGRVRQIVSNLVGNALKFTDQGAIRVIVETAAAPGNGCAVRIEVTDSGIGMDALTAARVFEAFEQGETGPARRHGGAGLGLPIVRLLARMMGGDVTVQAAPGTGSSFVVNLVLLGAATAEPAAIDPPAIAAPPAGHAWLVYRSEEPARWVQRRLARIGWTAEIFADLDSAVARLCADPERPPGSIIVADETLTDVPTLTRLRAALPQAVALTVLCRPDFRLGVLHEAAAASGFQLAMAPLTATDLRRLVLPAAASAAPPAAPATAVAASAARRVLVVEDVEINQLVVGEMIRALGLQADIASSGEEALHYCSRRAPDMVLMDIQMPGMDGLETSRRLRGLQHAGTMPHFAIVALTANVMDADREASLAAGLDEHVAKPVEIENLRAVLARWLPPRRASA